jgi:hypothetical protein
VRLFNPTLVHPTSFYLYNSPPTPHHLYHQT